MALDRSPDRSLGLRLGAAAALAVLLLVPFALLAAFVAGGWTPLADADVAISEALHSLALAHPGWVDAMLVLTNVFSPMVLRVAVLVLVVWLVRARHATGVAWWAGVTMAAGGILGALLKLLVGRDRPDLLNPVAQAAGYSFPSGHALNAALAAGIVVLVLLPFTAGRPGRRIALCGGAAGMAVVCGLTRIGLGVHYASDVVAGWLLGAAVVALTTIAYERWRARAGRRPARAADEGVAPEIATRSR